MIKEMKAQTEIYPKQLNNEKKQSSAFKEVKSKSVQTKKDKGNGELLAVKKEHVS